jgi:hypothetical protein
MMAVGSLVATRARLVGYKNVLGVGPWWGLFLVCLLPGVWLASDWHSVRLVAASGVAAGVGVLLSADRECVRALLHGFFIASVVSATVALLEWAGISGVSPPVEQKAGQWGLAYRSTVLSYQLAAAFVVWAYTGKGDGGFPGNRAGWWGCGALILGGLISTGARGGLLALAAAAAVLMVAEKRMRIPGAIAGLLGILIIGALVTFPHETVADAPLLRRLLPGAELDIDAYMTNRIGFWGDALSVDGVELVLGGGGAESGLYGRHNAVMEALVLGGIIGALGAIGLILSAALTSVRIAAIARQGGKRFTEIDDLALVVCGILMVFLVRGFLTTQNVILGGSGAIVFGVAYFCARRDLVRMRRARCRVSSAE